MIAIVAGGRDYTLTPRDELWLDSLGIVRLFSGAAQGADTAAELWARARGIPVQRFPAQWAYLGRGAGHLRNRFMAEELQREGFLRETRIAVVLFPGGRGTANMKRTARELGIETIERRQL